MNERRISGGGTDGSAAPSIGTLMRGKRESNAASSVEYEGEWKIEVKLDTAMNAPTKTSRMTANRVSGDDEQRDMAAADDEVCDACQEIAPAGSRQKKSGAKFLSF